MQTQPVCYQDKIIGNGYQNTLVGLFLASLDHNKAIKLETYTKRVLIMFTEMQIIISSYYQKN